jgi:hypothetical protein
MRLKGIINFLRAHLGYLVLAGFGDETDFSYSVWTSKQALELMALHPQQCFVQVINRYGQMVAERY